MNTSAKYARLDKINPPESLIFEITYDELYGSSSTKRAIALENIVLNLKGYLKVLYLADGSSVNDYQNTLRFFFTDTLFRYNDDEYFRAYNKNNDKGDVIFDIVKGSLTSGTVTYPIYTEFIKALNRESALKNIALILYKNLKITLQKNNLSWDVFNNLDGTKKLIRVWQSQLEDSIQKESLFEIYKIFENYNDRNEELCIKISKIFTSLAVYCLNFVWITENDYRRKQTGIVRIKESLYQLLNSLKQFINDPLLDLQASINSENSTREATEVKSFKSGLVSKLDAELDNLKKDLTDWMWVTMDLLSWIESFKEDTQALEEERKKPLVHKLSEQKEKQLEENDLNITDLKDSINKTKKIILRLLRDKKALERRISTYYNSVKILEKILEEADQKELIIYFRNNKLFEVIYEY